MSNATPQLITALDVPTRKEAEALVERMDDRGVFFKIGYQLIYGGDGLGLARELKRAGKKIFMDVKLLDIPNTVEKGVAGLAELGADFVTIHAEPHCMAAAKRAVEGTDTKLLGVTVMTSLDDEDLKASGYAYGVSDLVARRAKQATEIGIDGVICSAQEIEMVRDLSSGKLMAVTPGIRPKGSAADDQKRIFTPYQAIEAGAAHLVVGRPVYKANDPYAAAGAVNDEIHAANDAVTRIRPADPEDAAVLSDIDNDASKRFANMGGAFASAHLTGLTAAQYAEKFRQNELLWLIEHRDLPVGFVRAKPVDNLLYIAEIGVARAHQGKGLGRRLLAHMRRYARENEFKGLAGLTWKDVPFNGPYYLHNGFQEWSLDQAGPELRTLAASSDEQKLNTIGERMIFGERF
ncbi:orotidine-5'-phosphate decarboxylase [Maritalea myrionectae]|uniref:Orotidine 5'-phosphate decarboxylase n=2 Tax=Maritalea myrionectae TaxID=454601 RepID=A0A2R4MAB4_9HYPH|nr:orotidine-5'-phosphate decarboxylase [Maritalea myrionectae]